MIAISGPIISRWLPDGIHMEIQNEVSFVDHRGHKWVVPRLFVTDGGSIPREFWSLVGSPYTGAWRDFFVFHDAAYDNIGVAKVDADTMLFEALIATGCPDWLAHTIYTGVRVGGQASYTKDQIQAAKDAHDATKS